MLKLLWQLSGLSYTQDMYIRGCSSKYYNSEDKTSVKTKDITGYNYVLKIVITTFNNVSYTGYVYS